MSDLTLVPYAYDQIYPNPYQVQGDRRLHGPDFDDLVESIRVSGVQQHPPARPHPTIPGAVELIMGHRRLAASKIARPDEPFYIVPKTATEIEMLERCAEENLQRSDLNDIERAQMVEAYKTLKPDATNADMARVFKLKDPASITNIRKLLRLPAGIQSLVAENKIPDAIARQLVGVSAINPKAAQKIADEVAAAPRSEKAEVFQDRAQDVFWNKTVDLDEGGWSLEWLQDEPKEVERDLGDGDHFVGACAGCPFRIADKCARKVCFEEKLKIWTALELQRVSAEKKIPVAGPDEKAQVLFRGNYGDDESAAQLLNSKKEIRATLRLAPFEGFHYNHINRLLGSERVTLGSIDASACYAYIVERNSSGKSAKLAKPSSDANAEETDAQKAKRIEAEKKEQAANRAARSKMWKSYHDGLWLLEHAARLIGEELSLTIVNPKFVEMIEEEFCSHQNAALGAGVIEDKIEKEIKSESSKDVRDALRLTHVALNQIADGAVKSYFKASENERELDYEGVHEDAESVSKSFGVTLPDGWDVPPVHHTAFNCWQCGKFAGNTTEKLTQRDINEDGWVDDGKQGVFCSQEQKELYLARTSEPAAQTKATGNAKQSKAAKRIAEETRAGAERSSAVHSRKKGKRK